MPFDIIQDVPIMPRLREKKYNLDELRVGQALVIPQGVKHSQSAIYSAGRKLNIKLAVRKAIENDTTNEPPLFMAGDTLIWRVEKTD